MWFWWLACGVDGADVPAEPSVQEVPSQRVEAPLDEVPRVNDAPPPPPPEEKTPEEIEEPPMPEPSAKPVEAALKTVAAVAPISEPLSPEVSDSPPVQEVPDEAEPASIPDEVAPTNQGPKTYTLQSGRSFLAVVVFNDPASLASGLGHDHALVASRFQGTFRYDPSDIGACAVSISFNPADLVVDPKGARARTGLDPEGAVSESNNAKIKSNASGKRQLDVSRNPSISYRSVSCSSSQKGVVDVTGDLTIRGVAKRLTVPMTLDFEEGSVRARGRFQAGASDFGFKPFSALGGALKNQNRMAFVVDVRGVAQ